MKVLFRNAFCIAITFVILAGCAVGPDFKRPDMAVPNNYTSAPLPPQTVSTPTDGGASQQFVFARDLPNEWWTLFRSPELDMMIKQALADNPTVSAAQAALRKAQEDKKAQTGALFPSVDANFSVTKQKISG
ncbi:MAG: TolC family protein, partial [Smithella sp.]